MSTSPRSHPQQRPYYKQEQHHDYQYRHPPSSPHHHHRAKRPRPLSPGPETQDTPPPSASASASVPSPVSEDAQGASSINGSITTIPGQSSNFRNVSACSRCRARKNRCDQRLPNCTGCEKAGVDCIGYDPITKREVPRSYIFFLENRVLSLETLLESKGIPFPKADKLRLYSGAADRPTPSTQPLNQGVQTDALPAALDQRHKAGGSCCHTSCQVQRHVKGPASPSTAEPATSNYRFHGAISATNPPETAQLAPSHWREFSERDERAEFSRSVAKRDRDGGGSMRESFFGLHTNSLRHPVRQAEFPGKEVGLRLVELYFQHANPQIPILHRAEFMEIFHQAYTAEGSVRDRELCLLHMVFAIGSAQSLGDSADPDDGEKQYQPEEYYASAKEHFLTCSRITGIRAGNETERHLTALEYLQIHLLKASFALLRPVSPGLWYITGEAMRLAVDLGLHFEQGNEPQFRVDNARRQGDREADRDRGTREYMRDRRRRLWWCAYSLDRLISICVGRPLGVSDQVITTPFPSLADDRFITPQGIIIPPSGETAGPSYKFVAQHYFRLRLLQSEIVQALQIQQAQAACQQRMDTKMASPFPAQFASFRDWRRDIEKRLADWRDSAPTKEQTGVDFSTEFLEVNYWQVIIFLLRQSLPIPNDFRKEYHIFKEFNSPSIHNVELREDQEAVYVKVAEAGAKILKLYNRLNQRGVVNYTYLATHYVYMSGIYYLYAIWHSAQVRSNTLLDEINDTIARGHTVFTALIPKCPPAERCRDAFDRMAKATVKRAMMQGGFAPALVRQAENERQHRFLPEATSPAHSPHALKNEERWSTRTYSPTNLHRIGDASSNTPYSRSHYQEGSYIATLPSPPGHALRLPQPRSMHCDGLMKLENEAFGPSMQQSSSLDGSLGSIRPHDSQGAGEDVKAVATAADAMVSTFFSQQQTRRHSASSPTGAPNLPPPPTHLLRPHSGLPNGMEVLIATPQIQLQPQHHHRHHHHLPPTPNSYQPGMMNCEEPQGMDFMQSLMAVAPPGSDPFMDLQMNFGFGAGWGGQYQDFSDGSQVDLLGGFWADRQQGGFAGGGGL
ncbi:hypothetical protein PpBr36_01004 [Pyricularia pennisetigena]|uniref:hypothetical protein n=1 Tax=Pyricularia pennisetigena TaxID=1578925 RepID=UPI0011501388|nr:hypothetical protein PpBr36_01004 [Pyricularia pennisetigena]TLS28883.1 hypothetical protein PpBr36_01004 [Pyricularia pennisetigena]